MGTAGLGIILSIALSQPLILPISLVVTVGLYYCISEYEKSKDQNEFSAAINRYLDSVENELIIWFEHIEEFYKEQVEELKQTIEGSHNER
jgi:hypothetical protein